ncbi:MAG: hypothetical protein Hyperionvirus14_30 [Hyperionvirus sp.]|uniref:Uncharacterized protein n=1 Tax=Hyperionvirus sp. TaxID=2487770 RepID=A0A3G5ACF0_9VIRU|nr:MAG: hypothetical protein Hyperionvirus14_30 [Hyperionvirus sp.]
MSTYPSPYSIDDFQDIVSGYMQAEELLVDHDLKGKAKEQMRSLMREYFKAVKTVNEKNRIGLPILPMDLNNPQNVREMVGSFIDSSRLIDFSYFKPYENFVIKVVVESCAEEMLLEIFAKMEGFEPGTLWKQEDVDYLTYFFVKHGSEIDVSKKGLIIDTCFRKANIVEKKNCRKCKGWIGKCIFEDEAGHGSESKHFYVDDYVVLCESMECRKKAGYIYISGEDNWYMEASEETGACLCAPSPEKKLKHKIIVQSNI